MDYQPTTGQPMGQEASNKVWYIVAAVAVIVALALWGFYAGRTSDSSNESTATEQPQLSPLSSGNTIADISADLNQTSDDSGTLEAAAAASAQVVSGF